MLKDFFTSRLFIGALAFFLLVVGGSLLYSWHTLRTTERDMERHDRLLGQQKHNETRPAETVNVPTENETPVLMNTPDENSTPVLMNTPDENGTLHTETHSEETAEEKFSREMLEKMEVRVSPHGFGAYPPIPEGAPIAEFDEKDSVEMELLLRVAIKKWNEGHRFVGASIANGKVYLNYPNTLYVKWGAPQEDPEGNAFVPIVGTSGPGDLVLTPEQMHSGKIPEGVTVREFDSEGLDPYEVLELPK